MYKQLLVLERQIQSLQCQHCNLGNRHPADSLHLYFYKILHFWLGVFWKSNTQSNFPAPIFEDQVSFHYLI